MANNIDFEKAKEEFNALREEYIRQRGANNVDEALIENRLKEYVTIKGVHRRRTWDDNCDLGGPLCHETHTFRRHVTLYRDIRNKIDYQFVLKIGCLLETWLKKIFPNTNGNNLGLGKLLGKAKKEYKKIDDLLYKKTSEMVEARNVIVHHDRIIKQVEQSKKGKKGEKVFAGYFENLREYTGMEKSDVWELLGYDVKTGKKTIIEETAEKKEKTETLDVGEKYYVDQEYVSKCFNNALEFLEELK